MVEYTLIVTLIAIVAFGVMATIGQPIATRFGTLVSSLR